jgi:uncharacterized damage-inducible protein DinB
MPRPTPGTYPAYFENYIRLTEFDTPAEGVDKYSTYLNDFFSGLSTAKADYKYAPGKWSLKEMLLHMIDTERIFAYRALALSRGETTPLPGFDENSYASNSAAEQRTWESLLDEFKAVRFSTNLLLHSFTKEQLTRQGVTNNNPTSVNAIVYIIFGHLLHHVNVVKERYL